MNIDDFIQYLETRKNPTRLQQKLRHLLIAEWVRFNTENEQMLSGDPFGLTCSFTGKPAFGSVQLTSQKTAQVTFWYGSIFDSRCFEVLSFPYFESKLTTLDFVYISDDHAEYLLKENILKDITKDFCYEEQENAELELHELFNDL